MSYMWKERKKNKQTSFSDSQKMCYVFTEKKMIRKIGSFYQSDKNFSREEVFKKNIEVIVNLSSLAEDRSYEFYPLVKYYKIPISDCVPLKKNILSAIWELVKGKRALIHCYYGLSRSVSVIYYLHKLYLEPITIDEILSVHPYSMFCIDLEEE